MKEKVSIVSRVTRKNKVQVEFALLVRNLRLRVSVGTTKASKKFIFEPPGGEKDNLHEHLYSFPISRLRWGGKLKFNNNADSTRERVNS